MSNRIALFSGSLDPLTNGHLSIIKRASNLFDQLIIGVSVNTSKSMFFSIEEKIFLIEKSIEGISNATVLANKNELTINVAKQVGASFLIRGIRNSTDYEYERSISYMNQQLSPDIETVILLSDNEFCNVSSSMIKEIAKFGGDVSRFVPKVVNDAIIDKNRI